MRTTLSCQFMGTTRSLEEEATTAPERIRGEPGGCGAERERRGIPRGRRWANHGLECSAEGPELQGELRRAAGPGAAKGACRQRPERKSGFRHPAPGAE